MSEELLGSTAFRQAVSGLQKRAEKQTEWQQLEKVFVKTDLFDRVGSPDSQLVLGRRGTGKTHLFRMFYKDICEHGGIAFYFDCTRLGSGFSGLNIEPLGIATKYFVAFLNDFGTELLDTVSRLERPEEAIERAVLPRLSTLASEMQSSAGVGSTIPTFNYRQISDLLRSIAVSLQWQRVYLILDEWAHVPLQAQAYLAEFLKRTVLTVPQLSLKILAVNYQCQFSQRQNGNYLGLERGADIPDSIDLDRYLVYDERRDFVQEFFGQLLFNHLGANLGWRLESNAETKVADVCKLFTHRRAFTELVRAAEGNCRDFLCVFCRAYFDEYRQSGDSKLLSIPNVTKAAASWYDTEKAANVVAENDALETLTHLMNDVLKGYKSRTFLVAAGKVNHPRLMRLLNERILHRLNVTYSNPDTPGVRYELFTIDYGVFVRFRGTVNEVKEDVFIDSGSADESCVPIDDHRSIRRIVFDPDRVSQGATPYPLSNAEERLLFNKYE